jgi:hypothetical protein
MVSRRGWGHVVARKSSPPTGVGEDSRLWCLVLDTLGLMAQHQHNDPDLDGYVDWIVFDRTWGAFSEDLPSLEEARALSSRTGGGPVFRRQWTREPETD